MTLQMEKNHI